MSATQQIPARAVAVLGPIREDAATRVLVEMKELTGGTVRFRIRGRGLPPNSKHGIHIHRFGDLRQGCDSVCSHFTTAPGQTHGALNERGAHAGDLGNIVTDDKGDVIETLFTTNAVSIRYEEPSRCILGRSIVLHEGEDDLGLGPYPDSKTTGHSGRKILCGVIGIAPSCASQGCAPSASRSDLPLVR